MQKSNIQSKNNFIHLLNKNKIYLFILIIALFSIAFGKYLQTPKTIQQYISDHSIKLFGYALSYLGQLVAVTMVLKFFLGMKPFKDAIYDIFKEIFVKKDVIKQYSNIEIYNILTNISETHDYIEIQDLSNKYKSINTLKNNYKKNGSKHIYIESFYTTTIYNNHQVILHRKVECEMMESGKFEMKHYFIPFDKNIDIKVYKNDTELDRWNKKSFKMMTDGLENQDHQIVVDISKNYIKNKEWILFSFSCPYIPKGKKFTIEFSISDKIPNESFYDKKRLEEYFESEYKKPHGIRHVKFQIETYKGKSYFQYIPYIKIQKNNEEPKKIIKKSKRNIYYTSWEWILYYVENSESKIRFGIDENKK